MSHIAWADAWSQANRTFYAGHQAEDHFVTSIHVDEQVANALAKLIDQCHQHHRDRDFLVIDVGSGSGRLLEQLRTRVDSDVQLLGVDIRKRPTDLSHDIQWRQVQIGDSVHDVTGTSYASAGVVIAHEFLDDVPCEVFELDENASPRLVLVDPATGAEELGPHLNDSATATLLGSIRPDDVRAWLQAWWPATRPGARREVGITRQRVWSGLTRSVQDGCAVAIDYAHVRTERIAGTWDGGTMKGFRAGRPQRAVPDGSVNITAHVALDALASPHARLATQDKIVGKPTLTSWPGGLGSYTWLIEPIGASK
jgi:SAM-dependent MidA family methyltransferase